MKHKDRWAIERSLGKGGQGEVFLVKEKSTNEQTLVRDLFNAWPSNSAVFRGDERERLQDASMDMLAQIIDSRLRPRFGALKLLHHDDSARDPKRSRECAALEIQVMQKWQHPNLLSLKDYDGEELWYVSEFHTDGTLVQCLQTYAGDLPGTLCAIRPLVEGVALLHQNDAVHRDIKPHNIFAGSGGKLTLGDFGLIYLRDLENDRISATHSNVGTHAWMPGWAMEHRVTDLRPTFDVFSLGKVIWAMLSGKPSLTLWYYDRPQNNLEAQFPDLPQMRLANELFSLCVVENEEDCLPSAKELLNEIDRIVETISKGPSFFENVRRICKVCHKGEYQALRPNEKRNLGLNPGGTYGVEMYACNHCRHLELFYFDEHNPPAVWKDE